jgi:hypothetical protein
MRALRLTASEKWAAKRMGIKCPRYRVGCSAIRRSFAIDETKSAAVAIRSTKPSLRTSAGSTHRVSACLCVCVCVCVCACVCHELHSAHTFSTKHHRVQDAQAVHLVLLRQIELSRQLTDHKRARREVDAVDTAPVSRSYVPHVNLTPINPNKIPTARRLMSSCHESPHLPIRGMHHTHECTKT